jgi:heme-degrading monooxygenase HmoA
MAHVHIATTKGHTIETFRRVSAEHNAPPDVDGLLALAAGSDENGLSVVSIWESKAHQERWAAEQLFPAFQALGLSGVPDNTEFTEFDSGELYIR